MLREEQPYRFTSQRGWAFELVRAFRKQTDIAWGRYWDNKNNRSKTVYREITPRCVEAIAALLTYTYSQLASRIITLYQQERTQTIKDHKTIAEVFDALANRVDLPDTEGDKSEGWSGGVFNEKV